MTCSQSSVKPQIKWPELNGFLVHVVLGKIINMNHIYVVYKRYKGNKFQRLSLPGVRVRISSLCLKNAPIWLAPQTASINQVQLLACSRRNCFYWQEKGWRRISGALKPVAWGRWGSSAVEGSSPRGRKTLITNLRSLAGYPTAGKARGVNLIKIRSWSP